MYFKQNQVKVGVGRISVEIVYSELSSMQSDGFLSLLSCQCCRGVVLLLWWTTPVWVLNAHQECVCDPKIVTEYAFVLDLKCLCREPQFVHPPTLPRLSSRSDGNVSIRRTLGSAMMKLPRVKMIISICYFTGRGKKNAKLLILPHVHVRELFNFPGRRSIKLNPLFCSLL